MCLKVSDIFFSKLPHINRAKYIQRRLKGSQAGWGMNGSSAYGQILLSFYGSIFLLCLFYIFSLSLTAQIWCFESLFLASRSPLQPQESLSCPTVPYLRLAKCYSSKLVCVWLKKYSNSFNGFENIKTGKLMGWLNWRMPKINNIYNLQDKKQFGANKWMHRNKYRLSN